MFTHIVFFKLIDKSPGSLEKARQVLADMEGKIPFLRYIEVGIDVLHSERSYDLALVTKFDSLEDMQAYQVHPVHVEVAKYMRSVMESAAAVDYNSK
ncbi:MAG: Dabb family protein [Clostridia bacterium]|nr:Dabb family protein [Clostridia bacterium]